MSVVFAFGFPVRLLARSNGESTYRLCQFPLNMSEGVVQTLPVFTDDDLAERFVQSYSLAVGCSVIPMSRSDFLSTLKRLRGISTIVAFDPGKQTRDDRIFELENLIELLESDE